MKKAKPTTAITAIATTSGEWNQSSSLPLSSMSCIAPTHKTSKVRPTASIGALNVVESRLRYSTQVIEAAMIPTGMLI